MQTKFGIKVDPNMLTVHGRILNAPKLLYDQKYEAVRPHWGKWSLAEQKWNPAEEKASTKARPFARGAKIPNWNCLIFNAGKSHAIGQTSAIKLLKDFRLMLMNYGLELGPVEEDTPQFCQLDAADLQTKNGKNLHQAIENALRPLFKEGVSKFLYVILPSDNVLLYDLIKLKLDFGLGIPNVCSISTKMMREKGQAQYFANVALKFNLKAGGINHYLDPIDLKPLDKGTIVFGIDVTHPSPGSHEKTPSIAGVVASIDDKFCQYPASIRTQTGRQEKVSVLEEMISERLKLWQEKNNRLPDKVIVYRDGVSEGQYDMVRNDEYPQFVNAFKELYAKKPHPKITIITVGKRHHTRFYPTKTTEADKATSNPFPGTVVDRGVTGERLFDFYLIAHQALQGTSKPCHYVVLKDENGFGADELQKLVSRPVLSRNCARLLTRPDSQPVLHVWQSHALCISLPACILR